MKVKLTFENRKFSCRNVTECFTQKSPNHHSQLSPNDNLKQLNTVNTEQSESDSSDLDNNWQDARRRGRMRL